MKDRINKVWLVMGLLKSMTEALDSSDLEPAKCIHGLLLDNLGDLLKDSLKVD